jgi:hypothetical protein
MHLGCDWRAYWRTESALSGIRSESGKNGSVRLSQRPQLLSQSYRPQCIACLKTLMKLMKGVFKLIIVDKAASITICHLPSAEHGYGQGELLCFLLEAEVQRQQSFKCLVRSFRPSTLAEIMLAEISLTSHWCPRGPAGSFQMDGEACGERIAWYPRLCDEFRCRDQHGPARGVRERKQAELNEREHLPTPSTDPWGPLSGATGRIPAHSDVHASIE